LAMLGRLTRESVSEVGGIVAARLGWNADRLRVEIARALELLNANHQAQL
jgi:hypothetical protein